MFDTDSVYISRYLGTINLALSDARRRFDAWPGLLALRKTLQGRTFEVVLVGDHVPDTTRFGCVLQGIEFVLDDVPEQPAVSWRLRREHVWDVLEQPWSYIADPSRIELPPFTLLSPSAVAPPSGHHATHSLPSGLRHGDRMSPAVTLQPRRSGLPRPRLAPGGEG